MDDDYDRFGDDGRAPDQARTTPRPRAASRKPRSRTLILIIGIVGAGLIAAFVVWAYFAGEDYMAKEELPVISADRSPYKMAPDEPGGMDVPNQDKEVYERVGGEDGEKVERLLPPAAEAEAPANAAEMTEETKPMSGEERAGDSLTPPPPPQVRNESAEQVADAKMDEARETAAEKAGETAAKSESATTAAAASGAPQALTNEDSQTAQVSREELPPPPGAKTEETTPPTQTPANQPAATEAPATDAPTSQPAASAGNYRVQVASIQDRAKAESSWSAMQNKHQDVLGGLTLAIAEVQIEGRGTFYRLQGGSVSKERAEEICATLKQRNAGCLIVRP